MADGSVRFVPDSTNPKVFESMATISGAERVPLPGTLSPAPSIKDDHDASPGAAP
jgi:hypothetical protein